MPETMYTELGVGRGWSIASLWWWVALYIASWLLTGISCMIELPPDCHRAVGLTGFLTELPLLGALAVSQALFCGILDNTRLQSSCAKKCFSLALLISVLGLSVAMQGSGLLTGTLRGEGGNATLGQAFSAVLIALVAVAMSWHFVEAWNMSQKHNAEGNLPGAIGGTSVHIYHRDSSFTMREGTSTRGGPRVRRLTPAFREYVFSRAFVVVYVVAFTWNAVRWHGWGLSYILLSWVLSLLSKFDSLFSTVWLAATTTVFLQGIGSFSVRMIN